MYYSVSVIIPVYNASLYLNQCIDSILNQANEIILINDGSTDNSKDICDLFRQKYSHIKVVHNNNQGVSKSRNMGLALATSEYILFLDSDDWLEKNVLASIMSKNNKHYDWIIPGYQSVWNNGKKNVYKLHIQEYKCNSLGELFI